MFVKAYNAMAHLFVTRRVCSSSLLRKKRCQRGKVGFLHQDLF